MKLIGDDPKYERWRWQVFGITWLVYAAYYVTRQSFSVAKVLIPEQVIPRARLGAVDSAYLTVYALGQFIWGPLGDRVGTRKVLVIGMSLGIGVAVCCGFCLPLCDFLTNGCGLPATFSGFSITCFGFSISVDDFSIVFLAFVILMALQGLAQSTGWAPLTKTMSCWFSLHERGRIMGWWCTHYAIGAAFALWFIGYMMRRFGTQDPVAGKVIEYWPAGFFGPAAVLLVVFVLFLLLHRNKPEDLGLPSIEQYHGEAESVLATHEEPEPRAEGSWKIVVEVLRVPAVWALAISYFAIKLTRYALYFWGPKYVAERLDSGAYVSAMTTAALPLGGALGVLLSGYLSDKVFQSRRMPVSVISLVATAMVMLISLMQIGNLWLMGAFFFLIGFFLFGPDSIISGTAAMDFGTKKGASTAAGFVNGVGSVGAILGGFLPGMITTEENWQPIFWVFLGGLLFSATVLLPLWKTMPPTVEDTSK